MLNWRVTMQQGAGESESECGVGVLTARARRRQGTQSLCETLRPCDFAVQYSHFTIIQIDEYYTLLSLPIPVYLPREVHQQPDDDEQSNAS